MFEKIFATDRLSKRERVLRTLDLRPVDRVAIHEQLSYNGPVIARVTGRQISGFDFRPEDVGVAIRRTLDTCFPIFEDKGTGTETTADGFVLRHDHWTTWRMVRPFSDEDGAAVWLCRKVAAMEASGFNDHTAVQVERSSTAEPDRRFRAAEAWVEYRAMMEDLQRLVGETVIIDFSFTGFCDLYDAMGLEIFTFFSLKYPELLREYMEVAIANELQRVEAVADPELSPVILIPEDFATKPGPIFSPSFLETYHYPYVQRLTEVWHSKGLKVLYHSDGNYRKAIPALIDCGVDGFYCLEPACCMDVVELKRRWPGMVWAGGVDGVSLMERGIPETIKKEVHRHIRETMALEEGVCSWLPPARSIPSSHRRTSSP